MRLKKISVYNFRSIRSVVDLELKAFQAIIGENNCGKSNFLSSINAFLSAGSGGIKHEDFNNKEEKIKIVCTFSLDTDKYKQIWKQYQINNELILEKHIWIESDNDNNKDSIKSEYHGYKAEPREWFLSIKKIQERFDTGRPNWKAIVRENGLPDYFIENNSCTKAIFEKSLQRYFNENQIDYDEPDLSQTQALGFQSKVVSYLPKFYLLKAITDYNDEIDKRSTNTIFRRLMADLSERIIQADPRYSKIQEALTTINDLLNFEEVAITETEPIRESRLENLTRIETKIKEFLCRLMPSVEGIKLRVLTEDIKDIFTRGVEMTVDDGVETDVLKKGNGLQRCIIFSLLNTLIMNERNLLLAEEYAEEVDPIILAIEEPELYIHPQLGKLFYDVLHTFSASDQVIYTTHSPRFIDVYNYRNIAITRKSKEEGTTLKNCNIDVFANLEEKKIFKGLTQLNSDVNEMFFAKNVIVVEGPEDKIAITETLKKLGFITNRPEELDITITVTEGKQSIPFFVRVLNAFDINYVVLHDLDITENMPTDKRNTEQSKNDNIKGLVRNNKLVTFPIKLENTLNLDFHLKDQYETLKFFDNHDNINGELEGIVTLVKNKLLDQ